jgi:hypothetical protein
MLEIFKIIFVVSSFFLVIIKVDGKQEKSSEWNYKFAQTVGINSQMSLTCEPNNVLWIGWSHYGTRNPSINNNNNKINNKKINQFEKNTFNL